MKKTAVIQSLFPVVSSSRRKEKGFQSVYTMLLEQGIQHGNQLFGRKQE